MTRSRFRHASPSMVVACVALLIALGGTGVAAVTAVLPRNSVSVVLRVGFVRDDGQPLGDGRSKAA